MSNSYKDFIQSFLNPPRPINNTEFTLGEIATNTKRLQETYGESPVPTQVIFIGAGGVASWFLPQYIKTLYALKTARRDTSPTTITLYDFDTVEAKNILRQNFIPQDIGKNKAEVLADRYSELYPNIKIDYSPKYFIFCEDTTYEYRNHPMYRYMTENRESFTTPSYSYLRDCSQVFNFVDNEFTKHSIDLWLHYHSFFDNTFSTYYCTGCDISNGQVFVNKHSNSKLYTEYYEDVTFEDMEETLEDTTSCAELAEHAAVEQTFDSNTLAANLLNILVNNNLKNFWGTRTKEIKFICTGSPSVQSINNFDVFNSGNFLRLAEPSNPEEPLNHNEPNLNLFR